MYSGDDRAIIREFADADGDDTPSSSIYLVEPENFTHARNCSDWTKDEVRGHIFSCITLSSVARAKL